MRQRCNNPSSESFKWYGGRGIKVCDRWNQSFECFLTDMGVCPPELSIERINNDGNYCPENCRWETRSVQARNTSRNRLVELRGETKCMMEWCEIYGLKFSTVNNRIKRGWKLDRVFAPLVHGHRSQPIEHDGKSMMLTEWAKYLDVTYSSLHSRLNLMKWSVERAFTQNYQDCGREL